MRKVIALAGQVRAKRGRGTPCARLVCLVLRQPRVEQHAIQLGTNRRFLSTAHILLSSCVFAASARPPHTSLVTLLRVIGASWSPRGLHGARLSGAGRPAVLCERTASFLRGHRDVTVTLTGGPRLQPEPGHTTPYLRNREIDFSSSRFFQPH